MRGIGHEHRLVSALLVTPSAGDLQSGDGLTNSEDTYRTRKCFEGFIGAYRGFNLALDITNLDHLSAF